MPNEDVYCGLDLSLTATGLFFLEGSQIWMHEVNTVPKDFPDSIHRVEAIALEVLEYVKARNPCLVVVEDYFAGRNAKAVINLCELGTLVRYFLLKEGFPFIAVAPSQLKKFCLGKGNGAKELVIKGVYKKWGLDIDSNNIADAAVLAYMSRAINCTISQTPIKMLKYEEDTVESILSKRKVVKP